MVLLYLGLAIWSFGHLIQALGPGLRTRLMGRIGEGGYKGGFALMIVLSIVLIVFGWRASEPVPVYDVPSWGKHAGMLIVLLGFMLMAGSGMASNVKRVIRHPQLTGFALWGLGHLLSNGDSRSLALFGTMMVWAIVEIWAINRRDGPRETPGKMPIKGDITLVVAGCIGFAVFAFLHPYFTGVSPFTG